ncbi:MAG: DUF2058 domain-containing protein [Bermanella sp.]
MASLQEQLLKAGLVNKKKVKQAERNKQKVAKQKRQGEEVVDEAKTSAEAARISKQEKDKLHNEKIKADAQTKALQAQIKQLIQSHGIDRKYGDIDYNFTDGTKIKRIQVDSLMQHQLSRGMLAIAKIDTTYFVLPGVVAQKIRERDENSIIYQADLAINKADIEEDPYANYEIPDDLMW